MSNNGSINLYSSTLSRNSTGDGGRGISGGIESFGGSGGGIFVSSNGSINLYSSTLSHNSTGFGFSRGSGGGICGINGNINLYSSTLSHNSAGQESRGGDGGAIFIASSSITLDHCTISNNQARFQGGIFSINNSALSLNNSIIAGNSAYLVAINSPRTDPNIIIGDIISESGTNILEGDPLLYPLGDYGGPTHTMPPLPGSGAIDAATGTSHNTDQRGLSVGTPADIGAAELQQGEAESLFLTDNDNDGIPQGLEYILGTDINNPDAGNPSNLRITFDGNGDPNLRFGMNTQALPDGITLNIERSLDLATYSIIGSYTTTDDIFTTTDTNDSFNTDNSTTEPTFLFIDQNQTESKVFYRLEALLNP